MKIRREGMEEAESRLADVVSKPDRSFKELSGKEKAGYILDYYKWYILAAIVVIIAVVSLANHYLYHNQKIRVYGVAVNVDGPMEKMDQVSGEYTAFSGLDPRKEQAVLEYNLFMGNDGSVAANADYTTVMKLVTLFAAQEVDYMVCNQTVFDEYSRSGGFADLSKLLPEDLYRSLEAEGRIISGTWIPEEGAAGVTYPMAIEITGLPFTNAHDWKQTSGDVLCLTIANNSKRQPEAVNVVRMILGLSYVPAAQE